MFIRPFKAFPAGALYPYYCRRIKNAWSRCVDLHITDGAEVSELMSTSPVARGGTIDTIGKMGNHFREGAKE